MSETENDSSNQKLNEFNYDLFLEDTQILQEKIELDLILDKIKVIFSKEKRKFINLKLIYTATNDGDSAEDFHLHCDGYAPLIILIKTTKKVVFGGFTEKPFYSTKKRIGNKDDNAFIFSVDRMKTYEVEKGTIATCSFRDYGPVFAGFEHNNIYLFDDFFTDPGNVAEKGDRFRTTENYEINLGEEKFFVEEMEIYQVLFNEEKDVKEEKKVNLKNL